MKRCFDLLLAVCATLILLLPILITALCVKLTSRGPAVYWSDRVGKNNVIFKMPKFRSMRIDTPAVATHLLSNPDQYLTPIGSFLRKSSLDELPQLWSILNGDMSFVGPRPALYNQHDLIALRTEKNVHTIPPGLTGWAQVNGRDELPIPVKVELDAYYLQHQSFLLDMRILLMTFFKVLRRDGITH
ncbi:MULTISPECIES: sugar transferase [Undibacterium]|uniref:Sugar transferase n=1 Tax=Undibacterium aquatile TaxID=1537398 RepID=A0ABR6XCG2_9BURK|nr:MULTISPECIES: sugar transferase [Undibacterium]MBC3810587.1 sugar transferase [Undibacterium aquatile]MBC3878351.1 sugar transferase [Undibacterium sp. FT79W]MBK1889178.1 sugar transferase [Undibacterium sp. 14-3-2]